MWVSIPTVPVSAWSAALLPTGKVLLFQNGTSMFLFDPKPQQFSARFSSRTNLFCAGLAFLADGRLLAVGGHAGKDPEDHFLGVKSAEIFDPWRERWDQIPDMAGGERWYPTAIALADGSALVASGTHAGEANETMEVLNPGRMEWELAGKRALPMYPWAAVTLQGEVLFYGPQSPTLLFQPALGTFRQVALRREGRSGGAGTLLNAQTGMALILGGGKPSTGTAEVFHPSENLWKPVKPMAYARHHPNVVLLPDGRVLVVGGHSEEAAKEEEEKAAKEGEPLPAEVFDPETGAWHEVAKARFGHGYHSTALLLPDGSVMAAGPQRNLEIYFPWYFFRKRPALEDAPSAIALGQTFLVKTPDASQVAKVVALRLSSATHSLNTDQRYIELAFTPASGGLAVTAPLKPTVAIPGYYLLFLVTAEKVPSEGRIVAIQ